MADSFASISVFIHDLRCQDLPPDAVHMGRRCLVDLLAIWASGMATQPSQVAHDHAARRRSGGPDCVPMPLDGRVVNPVGYAFAGAATIDAIDGHHDQPEIWHLVDRVRLRENATYSKAFPEERYADVTLVLSGGQRLSSDRVAARGNHDAPRSDMEILAKLKHYAAPVLSREKRAIIAQILTAPEQAPSPTELASLLTSEPVSA